MNATAGPRQLWRGRVAVTLVGVISLVLGVASVSAVLLPAPRAGAATDVVTNCSGDSSVAGSLPNEVVNATSGDEITFALACSTITLTSRLDISGLTISGPGAGSLAISGGGTTGVLYNGSSGSASISGLTIEDGADSTSGGGAIWNNGGVLTIAGCVFADNTSTFFGGAIWSNGTLTVSTTTFSGNNSTSGGYGGGAILVDGGTADIDTSTFSGNTAQGVGGGIFNQATLSVTNSTFAGNTTPSYGGAIINNPGTATITSSTFWGNSAGFGGAGLYNQSGDTLNVGADIVANSTGSDCLAQGAFTDLGYNLDDDGSCQFNGTGDLSDTPADLDPSGLQANGGTTQTIALESGSPAIDAVADPTLCPATDQRGSNRGVPCDMGAYDTDLSPTISGVAFSGASGFPTITVSGSGFGSESDLGEPAAAGCLETGSDFPAPSIALSDNGWTAGENGDCIGLNISSYSDSSITFTLGSGYTNTGPYTPLTEGDSFTMSVSGTTFTGTVHFPFQTPPIALVTDPGPNTLAPIDTTTGGGGTLFPFDASEPGDLAITPDGSTALVSGINSDDVTLVNTATDAEGSSITVGSDPEGIAITPDGSTAYVAVPGADRVVPINLATDTTGSPIQLEIAPVAMAISPDGTTAYAVSTNDDSVTPIDVATGNPGSAINVGDSPDAIAITPDGTTAYVVNSGDDNVSAIDLTTESIEANIPVGNSPDAIAITPDGTTAYVANSGDNTVTPIDLADNMAGTPINVGVNPKALVVTPDGATVEVVDFNDDAVTPIDTATQTAGTEISAGTDPWDVAVTPDQAPVASLSVTPANAGQPTGFSASASVAPSTPITNYAWNFGDGATANTSGPTTTHTYAHQGGFTATVTETDAGGTSLTKVFTGTTMSRNGGPQARATSSFTVGVVASDSCTVSGFGSAHFSTVLSETTAPPSTIDAGGTFQTGFGAQVTIPASVIDHFRSLGATSLTVGSQTTAENGHTSGGAASGAVSPNTESVAAANLPVSDATLAPNTPFTYTTTYNPVTWQTGPGTGLVNFVPGTINAAVTFVINGSPTTESVTCTPPAGVGILGSTTVEPPPANPTFQVPSSTPALQNQVSAGTDGGWSATVADTSRATVTGVKASVSVTDGHSPLTFDLSGMAASGTNCSNAGSGKLTCSIGNLAAGASASLDVLVNTTGLGVVSVTGSVSLSSSNAGSHATTLGSIAVVVVQGGNGTKAVATPGAPLVSTKKPLKMAKASVSLTLPTKKLTVKKRASTERDAAGPEASGTVSIKPPPVAVTLESLAPSAEPALCPSSGNLKCEGNIIQVFGNFSLYTSKLNPITTVVKFFYGSSVPSGSVYFLGSSGKKAVKLAACKKTSSGYNTPCVLGKEVDAGSTGNKYAQDTVYFTGNDPVMGRR
jgi:YVTN family beta-propeller protein